jgi:hypothetical protein
VPEAIARRLLRYPMLPAARIGRLAVGRAYQRCGIGGLLLMDAAARAHRAEQANFALLVDAKDDRAASFYERYGFVRFSGNPRILFLPRGSWRGNDEQFCNPLPHCGRGGDRSRSEWWVRVFL